MKNKKGWVKVVEAMFAILLFSGVILFVVGERGNDSDEFSREMQSIQILMLREIQFEESLRSSILGTEGEVDWEDEEFPRGIKDLIIGKTPGYLVCEAKICNPGEPCLMQDS